MVWIYRIYLSIYPLVNIWVLSFCVLVIINNVAMNIDAEVLVWT